MKTSTTRAHCVPDRPRPRLDRHPHVREGDRAFGPGQAYPAEEAQQTVRAELEAALDSIDQGIVMYDASWRLSLYNRRWAELLGFTDAFLDTRPSLEEVIRDEIERGIDADLPGDTEDKVRAWMQPVLAADGPFLSEQHLVDGTVIELWTNPLPSGGLVRTLTDITARTQLERALRDSAAALAQSQQQLRGLMDSIPADITLKDTQGRFLMINKATSNERRRSEAEVLGKTAYQLYPHDVAREIFQQEREVLQSRRPVEREYRLVSNTFRLYAFLSDEQHDSRDPASYLQTLNARLVDLLPGGQFATMLYAIIDRARDRLDYAAAAAPHPLIIGRSPARWGSGMAAVYRSACTGQSGSTHTTAVLRSLRATSCERGTVAF